ncbi:MAG: aldose epimerase [Brevundimonas sp. 32-68-21]|nr:MAG: aldose epimerase [Brevundimonas sp. 32-68-21]
MIQLAAGDWRATLRPELGGAVTALSWRGRDVLRPTPDDADGPLQTACFPLVPYANRIDGGRFEFEGRQVHLNPTPGFEPHALHGDGWRRPWRLEARDDRSAILVLEHDRGDWPWRWSARQEVGLDEAGLRISLSVTNMDDAPMPAGLGLHPCFVRPEDGRLMLEAEAVWRVDERLIPMALGSPDTVFDWTDGPRIEDAPFVDNAYAGWNGIARIADEARMVTLEASANVGWAHVYAPRGAGFVCVEPVTHRPDALNARTGEASGLIVLQPGETAAMSLMITAA